MPMRDWTASRTFSRTVRPGNTLVIWKERPIPSRVRACGERRVMSRPLNRMLPRVGFSCPLSRLKKVVFPAPLGPMMDVRRFFGMLTLTPLTATCPPKETVKSRVSSRVSIGSSLPSDEERHAPLLPAVGCRSAALTACFRPAAPPPPVKFRGSTPAPAHRNLLSFPASPRTSPEGPDDLPGGTSSSPWVFQKTCPPSFESTAPPPDPRRFFSRLRQLRSPRTSPRG